MKIYSIFLKIMLILVLSSCAPKPKTPLPATIQYGDGGLFSKAPCGPPCFLGLIPGVSTLTDVNQFLKEKNLIDETKIVDQLGETAITNRYFIVRIDGKTKIVSAIGYEPQETIKVEHVVEVFGEPDAVWVTLLGREEETYSTSVILLYDKSGMTINVGEQKGKEFHLQKETLVEMIGYEDLDKNKDFYMGKLRQAWKGYTGYKQLPILGAFVKDVLS